jgi:hypothetical protein
VETERSRKGKLPRREIEGKIMRERGSEPLDIQPQK